MRVSNITQEQLIDFKNITKWIPSKPSIEGTRFIFKNKKYKFLSFQNELMFVGLINKNNIVAALDILFIDELINNIILINF